MDAAIEEAVISASAQLGYASLKDKQKAVITEFIYGRDVFAALPLMLQLLTTNI